MNDPSTNSSQTGDEIGAELRDLGKNLQDALRRLWESEERKKVQSDIESGLNDLGNSLNQAINDFKSSETGKTLQADFEDFQARLKTGEVETKARNEFLGALQRINAELRKIISPSDQSRASAEQVPPEPPPSNPA
jgi:uncharacterized phage infection (PIP) family protein YhgE